MKVLMINSVCGIRSTGRICTDIAESLEAYGHECKIAYGRESVPEQYQKYAVRIGNGVSVRSDALKTRLFDNAGFNSKIATRKFIKWLKEYDPDVIHLHNLHGYYLNLELLFHYLKGCGKKIIWTLHDCWAFTGHCAYFDFIGCDKWKTQCNKCPQKGRYPKSLAFDRSKRNYDKKKSLFCGLKDLTIVTPSHWLADLVKGSFLQEYPVKVIPNGIDLDVFKPTESDFRRRYGVEDKKILLGVASVWEERKGFTDFLKLAERIGEDCRIVLVGVNEKQMSKLPSNVIGILRTNNVRELAEIYTAADVFINPSREETMGLVTAEAMACGTPVIVYDKTAVPEIVDGKSGKIVKAGDIEEIYSSFKTLTCDNKDCRTKASEYEKKKQYQKYIELYCEK